MHIIFDPWAENVPTYSRWLLGVYSTPYDHSKKHYEVKCPGVGEVPPAGSWTNISVLRSLLQLTMKRDSSVTISATG